MSVAKDQFTSEEVIWIDKADDLSYASFKVFRTANILIGGSGVTAPGPLPLLYNPLW